ncbi:MAG: recombinase family protein [Bacteroidota bacterium]
MSRRRALLYTRVSTDEQADRGYSLRDQEARLRAYCDRQHLEVIGHYQDDYSAKTFQRPAWAQLMAHVKAGPSAVDLVLVVKWDRFSRDATGALSMIRHLEELGVGVQAIEQPIDRSVPEQLMMLAIYVAAPEVENRRRSLATKAGMRRAKLEGRWMGRAPAGYRNARDSAGTAVIELDAEAAPLVREAFRLAADTDLPLDEIHRQARAAGLRMSKSVFHRMLRDVVYTGRIAVEAWRGEPAREVEGRHEAMIDAATFARVQARRFGARDGKRGYKSLKPELPLRGYLRCPETNVLLTGSGSRSRQGHRVWYYHGQGRGAHRMRALEAHTRFEALLSELTPRPGVVALLRVMAEEALKQETAGQERRAKKARATIAEAEAKLLAADERFLDGDLPKDAYERVRGKWSRLLTEARVALADTEAGAIGRAERLDFAVEVLRRVPQVWSAAEIQARHALLGSMWPDGFRLAGTDYRTAFLAPVIGF